MQWAQNRGVNGACRYLFQGQERDTETFRGGSYNYTYRMMHPGLGRFFAIDPLVNEIHTWSPYTFSGNIVIVAREIEGLEPGIAFPSTDIYMNVVATGSENTNWHVFKAYSYADMQVELDCINSSDNLQEITYIFISGHGNIAQMANITNPIDNDGFDPTTDTDGYAIDAYEFGLYNDYLELGEEDFRDQYATWSLSYDKVVDGVQTTITLDVDYLVDVLFKELSDFIGVLNSLPDGGVVVFGVCEMGQAKELLTAIYKQTGSRLTFYASNDIYVTITMSGVNDPLFGSDNTNSGEDLGWSVISPNTGGEVVPVVNSSGVLGTVILMDEGDEPVVIEFDEDDDSGE